MFKERAESVTRLTINADLFVTRSSNCRNHTDFQKCLGRVLSPEMEKRTTALARAHGSGRLLAGLSCGEQLWSFFLAAGNCSTFVCPPQERAGLDLGTGTVTW